MALATSTIFFWWRRLAKDGVTLLEQGYTTDLIKDAAIELIEKRSQDDKPLFLFVSFNAIHTPIEEPETPDKAHQGRYIAAHDLLAGSSHRRDPNSIRERPWGQDTIIVFASDNGGSSPKPWWVELLIPPMRDGFSSNGELKQGKGSVFEGGIRVPAAIWWPGKIESAQALSEVVHVADVLPTLADFVGAPITKVDGRSIRDALLNNKPLPERAIVVANFDSEALIEWPWKIVREGSLPMTPDFEIRDLVPIQH